MQTITRDKATQLLASPPTGFTKDEWQPVVQVALNAGHFRFGSEYYEISDIAQKQNVCVCPITLEECEFRITTLNKTCCAILCGKH